MLIAFAFRGQQLLCVRIANNAVHTILLRHWKHPLCVHNYYPRSFPTSANHRAAWPWARRCCRSYYYRVPVGKWTPRSSSVHAM